MSEYDPLLSQLPTDGVQVVFLVACLLVVVIVALYSQHLGVPPMDSSRAGRKAILDLLPEQPNGPIYDLGSGWGGLAFAIAARYPDQRVVGIELSPVPYAVSRLRQLVQRRPNLSLQRANFLDVPLGNAGAATCYLMGPIMERLGEKLRRELKPGTIVVSHGFAFPNWSPARQTTTQSLSPAPVYRYEV